MSSCLTCVAYMPLLFPCCLIGAYTFSGAIPVLTVSKEVEDSKEVDTEEAVSWVAPLRRSHVYCQIATADPRRPRDPSDFNTSQSLDFRTSLPVSTKQSNVEHMACIEWPRLRPKIEELPCTS